MAEPGLEPKARNAHFRAFPGRSSTLCCIRRQEGWDDPGLIAEVTQALRINSAQCFTRLAKTLSHKISIRCLGKKFLSDRKGK